jgi:hypothetical protein
MLSEKVQRLGVLFLYSLASSIGQEATASCVVDGVDPFECFPAEFGATQASVNRELIAAEPMTACTKLTGNLFGKIVLVDRGECTFYTKYLNVAASGAAAVMLADTTSHGSLPMLVRGQPDIDPGESDNPIPIVAMKRGARDKIMLLLNKQKLRAHINFGSGAQNEVKNLPKVGQRGKLTWFRGVAPARLCKPEEWISAGALAGATSPRSFKYVRMGDANNVVSEMVTHYKSPHNTAKTEVYEMESVDWDMTAHPYEAACVTSIANGCIDKKGAAYDELGAYEFPFSNMEFSTKGYIERPLDKFLRCRLLRTGSTFDNHEHYDRIFHFGEIWADAFSHAIFQTLPLLQIASAKMALFPNSKVLVPDHGPLKSMLMALGIDESRFIHLGKMYSAKTVHAVAYRSHAANVYQPQLGLQPRGILESIALKLSGGVSGGGALSKPPVQDLVLYLKRPVRATLGDQRSLLNEDEIIEQVRARLRPGLELKVFETVQYEDDEAKTAWDSDREIFRRAKAVFGPHGGAFGNILFAPKGTPVIEFNTLYQNVWRPQFYGLSQMVGLDYTLVEASRVGGTGDQHVDLKAKSLGPLNPLFYRVPMQVPVPAVLQALESAGVLTAAHGEL